MTYEEAVKFAEENIIAYTSEMADFKAIAIESIKKQIPKKPIDNTEQEWFQCPTCGRVAVIYYAGKRHHCKRCGQSLKWSDEDE